MSGVRSVAPECAPMLAASPGTSTAARKTARASALPTMEDCLALRSSQQKKKAVRGGEEEKKGHSDVNMNTAVPASRAGMTGMLPPKPKPDGMTTRRKRDEQWR